MDSKRLDDLIVAFGALHSRQQALQYWLAQTYLLMSLQQPGRMAEQIRKKLNLLMNEPPLGPPGMTPAQLDEIMVEELPMMLQVGHEIAEHLEGLQRHADERRVRQAADAR